MRNIHDVERKYERSLHCVRNAKISRKNRKLILDFSEKLKLRGTNGLTKFRIIWYMNKLSKIAGWMDKDFNKINKADIEHDSKQYVG